MTLYFLIFSGCRVLLVRGRLQDAGPGSIISQTVKPDYAGCNKRMGDKHSALLQGQFVPQLHVCPFL